jgi:hypothetical protein
MKRTRNKNLPRAEIIKKTVLKDSSIKSRMISLQLMLLTLAISRTASKFITHQEAVEAAKLLMGGWSKTRKGVLFHPKI